ncbi:MAG: TspO/MBR family protein, partial [Bacillota bacterium]
MKNKKWVPYLVSIIVALAIGFLSGLATSAGMADYERLIKPPLTPPSGVFPIVWPILYVLMGISAAIIWQSDSRARKKALRIYIVQLLLNALWSVLFFTLQAYFLAFVWLILLWVMILSMIIAFYRINRLAGLIQIPYLLWVSFAGYLNFAI